MINPFVLGAIRERRLMEAFRRQVLRMDLAGNTGYLNPQLYTSYVNGAANPVDPAIPPEYFIAQQQQMMAQLQPQSVVIPQPVVSTVDPNIQQLTALKAALRLGGIPW